MFLRLFGSGGAAAKELEGEEEEERGENLGGADILVCPESVSAGCTHLAERTW